MNTEHDWLVWWHDEGSGMRPVNGQDHESHVRDMTRIAWLNGAFGAADEIKRLRAERDEARRMWCELMAANTAAHREQVANLHGWDCFKEASDERHC